MTKELIANKIKELENEIQILKSKQPTAQSGFDKFVTNRWTGEELLRKHKLTDFGRWDVYGEDPNPDFNGPHVAPFLGTVEGTLQKAIEWAVGQREWMAWGGGGNIKPNVTQIIKV